MEPESARLQPALTQFNYHQLRQLAAHLRAEAASLRDDALLIDLGCGEKPYAPLFPLRYVGVDLSCAHGNPDCLARAEALPFRTHAADVALSTQSLEHAADPGVLLAEAHRVLRPGGTLLLSTHGVWVHHPDPHDYWRWTEEGLARIVAEHGFVVRRIRRQGELFLTGALLALYPLGAATVDRRAPVRAAAKVVVALVNLLGFVMETAGKLLPRHYASISYLIVAEKR